MSDARMADVGKKLMSDRRAVASGRIEIDRETFVKLERGELTKGDPLRLAEYAGITGAKRTSEWIPLCHPLPIDNVRVTCTLDAKAAAVIVEVEVRTTWKTGVEMEALTGTSAALLTLYDVLKADATSLVIGDVRLALKEGGKSARKPSLEGQTIALVTVSDRVSRGESEDRSLPALREEVERRGGRVVFTRVVADEIPAIAAAYREGAAAADIVISSGGTGLSPRDVTPEALASVCTRMLPGLGEAFRARTSAASEKAWLSRASAGVIDRSLVLALPGSPRAVVEGMTVLGDLLAHAVHTARGGGH